MLRNWPADRLLIGKKKEAEQAEFQVRDYIEQQARKQAEDQAGRLAAEKAKTAKSYRMILSLVGLSLMFYCLCCFLPFILTTLSSSFR